MKLPTIFLPHGGGPCFFMNPGDRPDTVWWPMEDYLRGLVSDLPQPPRAILPISGHLGDRHFTLHFYDRPSPPFAFSNFPPHTTEMPCDTPVSPNVARSQAGYLRAAG